MRTGFRMFRLPLFFVAAVVLLLSIVAGVFLYVISQLGPVSSQQDAQQFIVESGSGTTQVARQLDNARLIRSAFAFLVYATLEGVGTHLEAGIYRLQPSMDVPTIVRMLSHGQVDSNEAVMTIPEGWTMAQIGTYLVGKQLVTADAWEQIREVTDSRSIVPDASFLFLADKPVDAHLEGYLFPDTYRVYKNATAAEIVRKMLENFDRKLTPELRRKISAQGKTIFDIVTMASIVEREVRSDEDRRLVADIFWKRLQAGIALQSDATVNFVTGKSVVQASNADLAVDSPYNTYKYPGLPPGPIANPGLRSLEAVIDPEPNPYYYFLTTPGGDTVFSATLEEHYRNKAKYLK